MAQSKEAIKSNGGSLHIFQQFSNILRKFDYPDYFIIKRAMDVTISLIGLLLFSPLAIIIMALIKLDSKGPVFFYQERIGKNGKIFIIYKFRTMIVGAEKEGPAWPKENDPRVTKAGKFLRRTYIDELPQLLNVFKGDMSLVGPRPERVIFSERFNHTIPGFRRRLFVRPGITGYAQVKLKYYDPSRKSILKKNNYDLHYIRDMSLLWDLKIMFWTLGFLWKKIFQKGKKGYEG